jgi:hypothetical protein
VPRRCIRSSQREQHTHQRNGEPHFGPNNISAYRWLVLPCGSEERKNCEYQKIGRLFNLREGRRDKKVIKLNKVFTYKQQKTAILIPNTKNVNIETANIENFSIYCQKLILNYETIDCFHLESQYSMFDMGYNFYDFFMNFF